MTKDQELEIAIEVSSEFWNEKIAKHGSLYVDEHFESFKEEVTNEVRRAINETLREEDIAHKEWLDDYYNDPIVELGARQQDLIDRYRFER